MTSRGKKGAPRQTRRSRGRRARGRTPSLSPEEQAALGAIVAELEVVRLDQPSAITITLPAIGELLGFDAMACIELVDRGPGWSVERCETAHVPNPPRFRQLVTALFERAQRPLPGVDLAAPPADQRNVAVDVVEASRGMFARSALYAEVLLPVRLHELRPIRALICEEDLLLAWFGGFARDSATPRQLAQFDALVPAIRRRLSVERRLNTSTLTSSALGVVLDHLGAPAFVIDGRARIVESNQAGRALRGHRRTEVAASLRAALAHDDGPIDFEITPLVASGAQPHWLAFAREEESEVRLARAIERATARLGLTARQRAVLELVVRGESNAVIAAELGIGERAVELHVTALLDRAAVDSRAALVSLVLLAG